MARRYWLFKTEPETFSWDDLEVSPDRRTSWEGVRNYQARNYLRDDVKLGDGVLFYHSVKKPPEIIGLAKVVRESYPDPTQFDARSKYYDPDSDPSDPRWFMVDIAADQRLPRPLPLPELKAVLALRDMVLLKKGSRLSIQPVTAEEWKAVLALARSRSVAHGSDGGSWSPG